MKLILMLKPAQEKLKAAQKAWNDADDAVIDAQADYDQAVYLVLTALGRLQLETMVVVGRDFENALFRTLFPQGLTGLKKKKGNELREELMRIISVLRSLAQSHPLVEHLKSLVELEKAWAAPTRMLEEAKVKRAAAESTMRGAREKWMDAYDALAGALRQEFPRNRGFVNAFFPPVRAEKKKEEKQQPAGKTAPAAA